jgi:hypothetical protein
MQHLFAGFFQFGYVTRDLDAACAAFRDKFGAIDFLLYEPPAIDGVPAATRRIALTYIDDVMTEIIEPDSSQSTIYDQALPANEGPIRLHHLGFLVDDHEAMLQQLAIAKYAVPVAGRVPGFIGYSYADTRAEMGLFCEFICLEPAGTEFFGGVPRLHTR